MTARTAVLAAVIFTLSCISAFGGERIKFDAARFSADQKAGKSIFVHITAGWCPTCKAQKPIVDALSAKPEFRDLVVYDLDFDTGLADVRALRARSQSTLIAFKGEKETGRSGGDTRAESIEALMKSTQ